MFYLTATNQIIPMHYFIVEHLKNIYIFSERLRWSRGSVLAFSTQVRGFKPGRSRRIFKGETNPQHPSLNGVEVVISAKLPDNILAHSSHFRRWDLSRRGGRGGTWW